MQVWGINTVDEVKERITELGFEVAEWPDAKIEKILLEAQRFFQLRTHREFEQTTVTRKLNGTGKNLLVLPFIPIVSVTSITILYSSLFTPLQITGYRVKEQTGEVILTSVNSGEGLIYNVWPEGQANIEAVWIHGYDPADVPADIVDAMILSAVIEIIERDPRDWESEGFTSVKIGDYSENYGAGDYFGGVYGSQKKKWQARIEAIVAKHRKTIIL